MNHKIVINVVVLRHKSQFEVLCDPKDSVAKFKGMCRRYSKIPLGEFCLICDGSIVDENLHIAETTISQVKAVFVFATSLKQKIRKLNIEEELRRVMDEASKESDIEPYKEQEEFFDDHRYKPRIGENLLLYTDIIGSLFGGRSAFYQ